MPPRHSMPPGYHGSGPKKNSMVPWIVASIAGALAIGAIIICIAALNKKDEVIKVTAISKNTPLSDQIHGGELQDISAADEDKKSSNDEQTPASGKRSQTKAPVAPPKPAPTPDPEPEPAYYANAWYSGLSAGKYRMNITVQDPYNPSKKYKCHVDFKYNGGTEGYLSNATYYNDSFGGKLSVSGSYSDDTIVFEGSERGGKSFTLQCNWSSGNSFYGYNYYGDTTMSITSTLKKI